MAAEIEHQPARCLVRVFAEFSLLPDLLARVTLGQQERTVRAWGQFFRDVGANTDHLEDEDIPAGLDEKQFMALDAWALCNRLGFIVPDCQLSAAAQSLALQSETPLHTRLAAHDAAVSGVLAQQIREQFRGVDGLFIVDLLQDCARALKHSDAAWTNLCPGLLLVEVLYLIEIAHTDFELAQQQINQLVEARDSIMQALDMSAPAPDNAFNDMLDYADTVAEFYLTELDHLGDQKTDLTAIHATAMLLTYAGLLDYGGSVLEPVQCLSAPDTVADMAGSGDDKHSLPVIGEIIP